jgi:hypothetical protein
MKIALTLSGIGEDSKDIELNLIKNSLEDENIKIKISYQEVSIKLVDLEKAIKYIKRGVDDEKI